MFTHLHVHTTYSLLDGLTKVKDLVSYAKELGMTSVAITDHGNMYGAIDFYQTCKKNGIKPIIGEEFYTTPDMHSKKAGDPRYHLILLAKDLDGYKNLIKLTSLASSDGYYYKPRIDFKLLKENAKGLICLTACIQGEIPQAIKNREFVKAEQLIEQYIEVFGKENFFFELQYLPNVDGLDFVNEKLLEYAKKYDIKCVGTCDSHYLKKEDAQTQDILLCIQMKKLITETNRMSMMDFDVHFRTEEEMLEIPLYKDHPELINNTQIIADACNVELEMGVTKLPYYPLPEGVTPEQEIINIARQNCKYKYGCEFDELPENIKQRFDYELSVIKKMGYECYFLIVQDFINWGKHNGVAIGPGRGSGAGSIIAYMLNITNLEPIKYNLLFERFLNPDRISMPDIDTDFADSGRSKVIEYVCQKYGRDHVAQIATFGTMASRVAVKDVGRAMGYSFDFMDKLAKAIPQGSDIADAFNESPEFKEMYDTNPDVKRIVDQAKKLEGGVRNSSVHACGLLITKDPLNETAPTQRDEASNFLISQYSLHPVEDLGLLKMDFLGLKNLTILENAVRLVDKVHGIKINLDELKAPDGYTTDPGCTFTKEEINTFKLFQAGDTTGVFQLESSGMKKYLKELKPSGFEDIIAMVALYRPGPMQFIPHFIARKNGTEEVSYDNPLAEKALKNTYGITVYQEQVMQLSKDLANFTGGQSDGLRKAIGKKNAKLMAEYKDKFIEGGQTNSIKKEILEKIWKEWEAFAEYCFNRSHAACYALVAYQTAYIKANWPECFMAALLMSDSDDLERIAIEIRDVKNSGIDVLPPDINESFKDFTVVKRPDREGYDIRFGLSAIKNVGEHIVEDILKERKENGVFKSVEDLLQRIQSKDLNKKSIEAFAKSGTLDSLEDRNILLTNIETLLSYNRNVKEEKNTKQVNIFAAMTASGESSLPKLVLEKTDNIDNKTKLAYEKEMLGLYISDHPMGEYTKEIKNKINITPLNKLRFCRTKNINIAVMISIIKKITTKNNEVMAFITIEDEAGDASELIVFPKTYKANMTILEKDKPILVNGTISDKDGEMKVLANTIYEITQINSVEICNAIKEDFAKNEKKSRIDFSKFKKKEKPQDENTNTETTDTKSPVAVKNDLPKENNPAITKHTSPKEKPAAKVEPEIKTLNIRIKKTTTPENIKELKELLKQNNNNGNYKVCFVIEGNNDQKLSTNFCINLTQQLAEKIKSLTN